jgi:hypothetical protein
VPAERLRGVGHPLVWLAPAVAAILVWGVAQPPAAQGIVFLTMLAGLAEMARAVVRRDHRAKFL